MSAKVELGNFMVIKESEQHSMYEVWFVVSAGENLHWFSLLKKCVYECDFLPEDREKVRIWAYKENKDEINELKQICIEKSNQLKDLCDEIDSDVEL